MKTVLFDFHLTNAITKFHRTNPSIFFIIRLDVQTEYPKMQLIWQLFDGSRQDFPLDVLSDSEKVGDNLFL